MLIYARWGFLQALFFVIHSYTGILNSVQVINYFKLVNVFLCL